MMPNSQCLVPVQDMWIWLVKMGMNFRVNICPSHNFYYSFCEQKGKRSGRDEIIDLSYMNKARASILKRCEMFATKLDETIQNLPGFMGFSINMKLIRFVKRLKLMKQLNQNKVMFLRPIQPNITALHSFVVKTPNFTPFYAFLQPQNSK